MSERVDIGHGVLIAPCHYPAEVAPELAGKLAGFDYWHPCRDGKLSIGYVPVGDGPNDWKLVERDPLTLAPSLLCRACGHHGWVQSGKWIPA